jgi:hypothetical protein
MELLTSRSFNEAFEQKKLQWSFQTVEISMELLANRNINDQTLKQL